MNFWRTPFGWVLYELGPFSRSMGAASAFLAVAVVCALIPAFVLAPLVTGVLLALLAILGTLPFLWLQSRTPALCVTAHGENLVLTKSGVILGTYDCDEEGREQLQARIVNEQRTQEDAAARAAQAKMIADAVNRALK